MSSSRLAFALNGPQNKVALALLATRLEVLFKSEELLTSKEKPEILKILKLLGICIDGRNPELGFSWVLNGAQRN